MEHIELRVDGLARDVEILVDHWGIPHIYAEDQDDLFFAQGFNAARDRLFQLDLWRRRGLGLLAEAFGPRFVEQDRAARLMLFEGDMRAEWLAYGPGTERIVTSFTQGINAYLAWAGDDPDRLPPEFAAYGHLPDRWAPEDVPRIRGHGLFYNVEQEFARAVTVRDHGWVAERLRQTREPDDPPYLPEGLDLDTLTGDVLRVYLLARSPVLPVPTAIGESAGSNNWVISADRTATGRPLLANDPHRTVSLPALRYIAHLSAPGIDVIGGGEPALPGISIGHNGRVGFGLTIWPADQEDLYVYETHPDGRPAYRYRGGWEDMRVRTERIRDSAGREHVTELRFTHHGPVIHERPGVAVALRAAWLETGMAPYLASLAYLGAEDAAQFVDALGRWGAPPVNQVYADTAGTIGWKNAGLVPVRPGWDGSLPVPGDGRYEWDGFYDAADLPGSANPPTGWIATANQMNLPPGYPNDKRTITYDWYSAARYERITDVLSEVGPHDVDGSVELQNDVVNVLAREIVAMLRRIPAALVAEADTLRSLLSWTGGEDVDSREALVFQIWSRHHLRPLLQRYALRQAGLDEERVTAAVRAIQRDEAFSPDLRGELYVLRSFDLADPADVETLARIVDHSLTSAIAEITDLLGPDRSTWTWGRLHRSEIRHPFLYPLGDLPDEWRGVGPAPKRGSGDTVAMAAYDASYTMTHGSTFRIVLDVGDWDGSVAMNAPGQSGDPRSPHYADLFQPWLDAQAFPLCYTRQAVEQHAEQRIVLRAHP